MINIEKVYPYRRALLSERGTRIPREMAEAVWECVPRELRDSHVVVVFSTYESKWTMLWSDNCYLVQGEKVRPWEGAFLYRRPGHKETYVTMRGETRSRYTYFTPDGYPAHQAGERIIATWAPLKEFSLAMVQTLFYQEFGNRVPSRLEFSTWYDDLHPGQQAELDAAYHAGSNLGDTLLAKMSEFVR